MTDNSAQNDWVNETGKLIKCLKPEFVSGNMDGFGWNSPHCKETLFLDKMGLEYCMNCTNQEETLLVSLQLMEKTLGFV